MSIGQGLTQTTTITVTSISAAGSVALTGNPPASLTLVFQPPVVQVIPTTSVNSTMAITVANDATPGSYNITVSGNNNGVSESTKIFVTVTPSTSVGDFYLSPNPSSLSIPQGQARMVTVTVSSVNGFNGTVKLGASAGVSLTASFNPTVVDMLPDMSSNSTMTVILPAGTNPGSYAVTISGTSGSLSRLTFVTLVVVTSTDEPPIASFTFTPPNPVAGHSVQFNATASYDPDGGVTGYSWAWGDGQSGAGAIASHSFEFSGRYTVTLTVTDSGGAVGGVTRDVLVAPPVSAPATGQLRINVRESNNNPIGGATVLITAVPPGQSLPPSQTTGANGSVTFLSLLPGSYTYKVSAAGYSDSSLISTTVSAGQTRMDYASLSKIQAAAPTPADYTIVYAAGALALITALGVFLTVRRRHRAKPGRNPRKQRATS